LRYFIEIAYKGTEFHGWQIQPNAVSIQETIERGLQTLLRTKTSLISAGRTDAGVHALQIFAHFNTDTLLNKTDFVYRLNAIVPISIFIKNIFLVTDNAHARFDALSRSYYYHIYLGTNPFITENTWQIPRKKFDVKKMNEAAQILLNHTDFQAFSKSKTDVNNYNCKIEKAEWIVKDKSLGFHITANRFLRNMVRAIVGTLLEVGEGKLSLQEFEKIILSKNRSNAGISVPAKGLFLAKITYPESLFIN